MRTIVPGKVFETIMQAYRDHVIYYTVAMDGWISRHTQCHAQRSYASQNLFQQQ